MIDYTVALQCFYGLLFISVVAAGVLLISYQQQRQNLLIRSCCIVLLFMYGMILAGHLLRKDVAASDQGSFSEIQAVFLGYCYICIHAHACFMMLSNCYVAMGWKLRIFEQHVDRESTLVLLAYAFPVLFGALYALIRTNTTDLIKISHGPFFCTIVRPRFSLSIAWFMLFAIPGSILALYLLVKTWLARRRTLAFGSATQLTLPYLFRLTLSTGVYVLLAYGSFLPVLIYIFLEGSAGEFAPIPLDNLKSVSGTLGSAGGIYLSEYIPAILAFFPSVLGISLFLMYGFGSHARASYRYYFNLIRTCGGSLRVPESTRRYSTSPLITEPNSTDRRSSLAFPQFRPTVLASPIELPIEENNNPDSQTSRAENLCDLANLKSIRAD